MKKKMLFLGILVLSVLVLSGCGQKAAPQPTMPPPTLPGNVGVQESPMDVTTAPVVTLPEGIDPSAEEDTDAEPVDGFSPVSVPQDAPKPTTAPASGFAGATPIPLTPIDAPSAAPAEALTFTYSAYAATKLGLTFESVAGYIVDDTATDTYVLRQPEEQVMGNHRVEFTFSVRPVANNYAKGDVRSDLRDMLADMGKVNYQRWEPSAPAERTLLNAPGYYANYRGELPDGTVVRGRVHMALLSDKRVLTIHMSCPADYNTDYTAVFTRIRATLKTL